MEYILKKNTFIIIKSRASAEMYITSTARDKMESYECLMQPTQSIEVQRHMSGLGVKRSINSIQIYVIFIIRFMQCNKDDIQPPGGFSATFIYTQMLGRYQTYKVKPNLFQ